MNAKERGLSPFRGRNPDRLPMWYVGADETTRNIASFLGASSTEDALYNRLGIDYRYLNPRYTGPALRTHPDGSIDTIWGIRRGGAHYGQALNHPLQHCETVAEVEGYVCAVSFLWGGPRDLA